MHVLLCKGHALCGKFKFLLKHFKGTKVMDDKGALRQSHSLAPWSTLGMSLRRIVISSTRISLDTIVTTRYRETYLSSKIAN